MRLFIAIELPEQMRQILDQQIAKLDQQVDSRAVRWLPPGAVHLTLKFLGEVDDGQIPQIVEGIDRAASLHQRFGIGVGSLGCFPNCRRPRVIWIGITADETPLAALHSEIESELQALGFAPEQRRFHPHLTVGRIKRSATRSEEQSVPQRLEQVTIDELGRIEVTGISLMRSELRPTGARYTQLHKSDLK